MGMINKLKPFGEGEILVRWVNNRIRANKNALIVTTGSTGSGKSYNDLRKAELIHLKTFNEPFPIENCCFSVAELMRRVSDPKIRKGEVLILEEAGVNLGSSDWQNKIVKTFNYILQSFRSMNIIILFNLPVFGMLSKQARQLIHMHMETCGVDKINNKITIKALEHQLNQFTGKSYFKYLRVKQGERVVSVKRMQFGLPSPLLMTKYEQKKAMFLADITKEFSDKLDEIERDKLKKMERKELTQEQLEVYNALNEGLTPLQIVSAKNIPRSSVYSSINAIKSKGYKVFPKENPSIPV